MLIGLLHLHRTLGYLLFFVALLNLVVVITKGRTDPRAAKALRYMHSFGLLAVGRLNLVVGIALWAVSPQWSLATWWAWAGLVLWGPIEAVSKRMVQPEIALVQDGGSGSSQLVLGTAIELVCVVTIFGLMSARP